LTDNSNNIITTVKWISTADNV